MILVLWRYKSRSSGIKKDNLLVKVNQELEENEMGEVRFSELDEALQCLEKVRSVDVVNDSVRLIEDVRPALFKGSGT